MKLFVYKIEKSKNAITGYVAYKSKGKPVDHSGKKLNKEYNTPLALMYELQKTLIPNLRDEFMCTGYKFKLFITPEDTRPRFIMQETYNSGGTPLDSIDRWAMKTYLRAAVHHTNKSFRR